MFNTLLQHLHTFDSFGHHDIAKRSKMSKMSKMSKFQKFQKFQKMSRKMQKIIKMLIILDNPKTSKTKCKKECIYGF